MSTKKVKYNAKGRNMVISFDAEKLTKKQKKLKVFMDKELKKIHSKKVLEKFHTIQKVHDGILKSSKQFTRKKNPSETFLKIEPIDDEEDNEDDIESNLSPIIAQETVSDEVEQVNVETRPKKKRKRSKKSSVAEVIVVEQVDESEEDEEVIVPTQSKLDPNCPAYFVPIHRSEEIQTSRLSLPVVAQEQIIMETIMDNHITILCGETGSGKTTQIPQFLYEAGFGDKNHPLYSGMIGITQPRRVAAVSMAKRVAQEMNLSDGQVTYQIRYDKSNLGENSRIKFMTDGILLRELGSGVENDASNDLLLKKYSCIIIDEAHERTVGTDILIGWLTRIVQLRNSGKIKNVKPLKLIIMSATLRVQDFTENKTLFPEKIPPVIKVDGRQHKVIIHYNKKTPELDYISEAYKKVTKIHSKLPPGGILVFVTGQQEVQVLCKKLKTNFTCTEQYQPQLDETEDFESIDLKNNENNPDSYNESESDDEEESVQVLNGTMEEEVSKEDEDVETMDSNAPLHVLPLYSLLSTEDQLRVFQPPPPGSRLVIVATNVAETSITIPGIRYVVDCGKVKSRRYDTQTGLENFEVGWTCKASSDQRAGRAGRMGPGHCYRIFSSSVFEHYFPLFSKPEILRIPVDGVVLNMKSMGMNQIIGFPFPTPPDKERLKDAETMLKHIGAINSLSKITKLGSMMAQFPIHPRYSRMIVSCIDYPDLLPYLIAISAGLSVNDIFQRDMDLLQTQTEDMGHDEKEERKQKRGKYFKKMLMFAGAKPTSDAMMILTAIGAYLEEYRKNPKKVSEFCSNHFLRIKAMDEVVKLIHQLTNLSKTVMKIDIIFQMQLLPPTKKQQQLIKQIMLNGYIDCVARLDDNVTYGEMHLPVYQTIWSNSKEQFLIHPSSCLHRERPAPSWVVFDKVQSKQQILGLDGTVLSLRESNDGVERKWLKGVTVINDTWLTNQSLTNFGALLDQPEPHYDPKEDKCIGYTNPTFGPKLWQLCLTKIDITNPIDNACYFAQGLLQGKVLFGFHPNQSVFKILQPCLLSKPNVLSKSWARNQSRVQQLLQALHGNNACSQTHLLDKWKKDPKFLSSEICQWLPLEFHSTIQNDWPPILFPNDVIKINTSLLDNLKIVIKEV